MAQVNILVVEDESIVSKDIQHSLKKLGYNVVGACSGGQEAVSAAEELGPDIIIMDIMLQGNLSGIDAAALIKEKVNIPVIYLTAYADQATLNKAKHTEPYGYVIKPYKEVDLQSSIEIALYKHKKAEEIKKERDLLYAIVENKENKDFLFVKSNSRLVKINTKDIYFIEALKDYVVINTLDVKYTIHSTMKDIEKKFSSSDFVRVHRSFIVRIDKIASIENANIVLENHTKQIPVGGSFKEEMTKRINLI